MRKYLLIFFIFFITPVVVQSASIKLTLYGIKKTDNGFLVKGKVTGYNLNSGGIVEFDKVGVAVEIPTSSDFLYPVFYQYESIAEGCKKIGKRCISQEEEHGRNIKVFFLFDGYLRPPDVWQRYGGLGKWETQAPSTKSVEFEGIIPLEYAGKKARLHAILTHVWGGPFAAWPAITFIHQAIAITLTNTGRIETPTPTPEQPNPCEPILKKMKEINISPENLNTLKEDLGYAEKRVKSGKETVKKLNRQIHDLALAHSGVSSVYHSIGEDIKQIKRLSQIGSNYGLVLQELDETVKLRNLTATRDAIKHAVELDEMEVRNLKQKIKLIEQYKKCREKRR